MMNFSEQQFKLKRIAALIAVIAASIALLGLFLHLVARIHLAYITKRDAVLNVAVVLAQRTPATEEIVLPGSVQAWHEATIYARVSGYIKTWYVDIGSKVQAGDVLARIEAPELDAQLRQAEADLATAMAKDALAQSTAARWQGLLTTDSVAKQEADEKISNAQTTSAMVNGAKANRDHLKELVSFERIVSPYAGVITSRLTDVGALINAGSGTGYKPLFTLAQADRLRIYVHVPQNYALNIPAGLIAQLNFGVPDKNFSAKLLDSASAIDPISRTLLLQFEMDNVQAKILPGGYVQVKLSLPTDPQQVILPVNTLLFRAQGLQVGVLDQLNKVTLQSVKLARDFGDTVEIASGLSVGEKVIVNPSDALYNGQQVKVIAVQKGEDYAS